MLKIENLTVSVEGREILHDINLHIRPGEVHVLFGPNGVGKSTLMGAIMGYSQYRITRGRIYFKGIDITEKPVFERAKLGIGIMIQRPPTIKGLTLRHMVELCGVEGKEAETYARWMGLDGFLERSVNDGFSGGEIKRSELLQLMAQKPDLLLLDEPESGVDVENIALVGRAANYILHDAACKCANSASCPASGEGFVCSRAAANPLAESGRSGLIITHLGHILKYIPTDVGHIVYGGTLTCQGEPQQMLSCIGESGYESCVHHGCGRMRK